MINKGAQQMSSQEPSKPEEIPGLAKYLPDKPQKSYGQCKKCGTDLTYGEATEYPAGLCDVCA